MLKPSWRRAAKNVRLGLLSQFTVVGLVAGVGIAAALSWLIETNITDLMLRQMQERAIEHVRFGSMSQVTRADLQPPFTSEGLAGLARRLGPVAESVDVDGESIVRIQLVARDGTIVFSDAIAQQGTAATVLPGSPLEGAFLGRIGAQVTQTAPTPLTTLEPFQGSVLDVYVPFSIDGDVVGAYVIGQSLKPVAPVRPLVWSLVTLGFLTLIIILLVIVHSAARRIQRQMEEREQLAEVAARAEAEMAAARELEQVKDELTSVVSHELRTPLASIVGFIELLLFREYPPAQERQFLQLVHSEGMRLTTLINDFLDLQRLESRRATIHRKPMDLTAVLSQAIAAAGDDPDRPITLSIEDTLPTVHADPDRVQQVLANLLSNARKYSPEGGAIYVHAREDADTLVVSVLDQGLGIPPAAVSRLFRKFYRVDNSDHREIKGTGLGLMICRKIVEAHGGAIWAESDGLGHGARFVFTLPLHHAHVHADGMNVDVLIVEDDPSFARLLETQLAERQIRAMIVGSAEAALGHVSSAGPRVIVLDLLLPGQQGETFLRELSASSSSPPACIVVTMKDLTAQEVQVLETHGAQAIVRKGPRAAVEVSGRVATLLEARTSESIPVS